MNRPSQVIEITDQTLAFHPGLTPNRDDLLAAYDMVVSAYRQGNKVLVCGNGGSCADSAHIVGELMKGFLKKRPIAQETAQKLASLDAERGPQLAAMLQQGLPAIDLTAHIALITACANDLSGESIFAQQVVGYGRPGDILIGLSTSGNARNVMDAFLVARALGLQTLALTGEKGGAMGAFADLAIRVPASRTPEIQEYHIAVYHALCAMVEAALFEA